MKAVLLRGLLAGMLSLTSLFVSVEAQSLQPDTRIRVSSVEAKTIGNIIRSTPDSVVFAMENGGIVATDWGRVTKLEISAGKRGHPGRGALIGAAFMTALTVGAIGLDGSNDEFGEDYEDTLLILALPLNAAFGAGIGALVGLVWRTEQWHTFPAYAPDRGGSLGVAYRF